MNARLWLCGLALAAAAGAAAAPAKKAPAPPPGAVTGRVLLSSGKPAPGARVWVGWMLGQGQGQGFTEGKADAAGAFRLVPVQKTAQGFWVGAAAPGAAPAWTSLREAEGPLGAVKPVTLKLPPPISLSGFVVDAAGRPKGGVTVQVPRLCSGQEGSLFASMGTAMVPPSPLAPLKAQSGPDGAFRISGLPPGQFAYVGLPQPMLSPPDWIRLGRGPVQPLGIVPAVRTGSLQVVAESRGEPASGGTAWLRRRVPPAAGELAAAFGRSVKASRADVRKIELEANGLGLVEGLAPGQYEVAFHGRSVPVEVPEGDAAPPVKLEVRALSGSGTVRDEAGKVVSGARVSVQIGDPVQDWPPGPANAVVTDERGAWTVEDFPWEAPLVVVRAQTPTASAEWKGSPAALRGPLALTLVAGKLLTVRGRLLVGGKPQPGAPVAAFTREGGRPQALAVGKTDAEGRFELGGVRRGVRFALGSVLGERPFESAFHQAPESAETLDLGDVPLGPQVAPAAAPGTPEWADLFRPAALPSEAELARAREAGFRFLEALRRGDAAAAHRLLSPISLYYQPDLKGFLSEGGSGLRIPVPEPGSLKQADLAPVRINPRNLLAFGEEESPEDRAALVRALDRPDWTVLAYGTPAGVHGLCIMHREADGWKVVDGIETAEAASFATGAEQLLYAPAPPVPAAALETAAAFLKAWSAGDFAGMRARTARDAREWAASDEAFRRAWEARPAAMKPDPGGARPESQPGLSAWDLLTLYLNGVLIGDYRPGQAGRDPAPAARSAAERARTGRLAAVRFRSGAQDYLMLLTREEAGWRVVESALAVGGKNE